MFGAKHLGAILGLNMAIMVVASAVGRYIYGFAYERAGSYTGGIFAGLALPAGVFVAGLFVQNPQESIESDENA